VAIANALQLETAQRRSSRSELFLANFVLRKSTNCYSQLSIKLPTSPLDKATQISKREE